MKSTVFLVFAGVLMTFNACCQDRIVLINGDTLNAQVLKVGRSQLTIKEATRERDVMDFIQEDFIEINQIIHHQQLKPFFLDVAKVASRIYSSYNGRFISKLKAHHRHASHSLHINGKLRFVVPDEHISRRSPKF